MKKLKDSIVGVFLFLLFLGVWQVFANHSPRTQFLFASPVLVAQKLVAKVGNGELLLHTAVTGLEAVAGFALGITVGSILGFALLYYPRVASVSRPYVIALGSIPIFALAPMMIVWFGIGIKMKIAMATFSTVLVAMLQAYEGGKNVSPDLRSLFELHNCSNAMMFWKLILPSSMEWVLASLRLNVGLALLGAFIGEFIASERGLGYAILRAGGVYDVPYVLGAVVCIIALALALNLGVKLIEQHRRYLVEFVSVPRILRAK